MFDRTVAIDSWSSEYSLLFFFIIFFLFVIIIILYFVDGGRSMELTIIVPSATFLPRIVIYCH